MASLLVTLLVALVVAAIVYWIVTLIPLPQPFKNIILAVLGLIFLLWLLSYFGVFNGESFHFRR
jgi:hypothetical protein